jgi:hypothetical protein
MICHPGNEPFEVSPAAAGTDELLLLGPAPEELLKLLSALTALIFVNGHFLSFCSSHSHD